jgi:hypothetical protein
MAETKRTNTVALSAGVLIVALGVSFLAAFALNNWWYFIPFMMLIYGGWIIVMGAFFVNKDVSKYVKADMMYSMMLGIILMAFGVVWMLLILYPGQYVLVLGVFIIVVGAVIVLANLMRNKKKA